MIKLFKPYVSWRSIWNVLRVLFSGQLAEGPEVKRFEKEFSEYHKLPNVLALNSGTSALELAAHLLDLKPDDEVICPVFTCAATVVPFLRRCKVKLADVDAYGGFAANISIRTVQEKVTPKTKAVVFVSFGGDNTGLREMAEFCQRNKLKLVHDAAQCYDFSPLPDFTCVSLQATKIVTAGDGGFLICRDFKDYERAKKLRWFGLSRGVPLDEQDISEAGYKFHMNEIAAAIGRGNLKYLPKLIRHRKKLAKILSPLGCASPWLIGMLRDPKDIKEIQSLTLPFEVGQHHVRLDKYSCLSGQGEFSRMDWLEGRYLFVPYGQHVSIRQAKKIINLLR